MPAVLTRLARAEVRAAAAYIAQDRPDAAHALVAAVQEAARIGAHPLIGTERPDYAPAPYRTAYSRCAASHTLFYNCTTVPPRILRVVHGARDLPRLLSALRD